VDIISWILTGIEELAKISDLTKDGFFYCEILLGDVLGVLLAF
jgi:hypothetical protein